MDALELRVGPHGLAGTLACPAAARGDDTEVLALNRAALAELRCEKRLEVIPGATHLFEEPGTLDAVAQFAGAWFERHLGPATDTP